jgi:hypothetical protein
MTTLSTGTTTTSAYVLTPDTSGAFVLKTGSSNITAVTVDTSQNVAVAGTITSGSSLIPNADIFRLNAPLAGANATGAQNMLGVGVTLAAGTVYAFELVFGINKTAGTTSHTISLGFGGTATINNISYFITRIGSGTTFIDTSVTSLSYLVQTAAATALTSAITTAGRYDIGNVKGTISINAGGTFIPQYSLSAAPGGAYTTAAGSFMIIYPIGAAGANTNVGGWA